MVMQVVSNNCLDGKFVSVNEFVKIYSDFLNNIYVTCLVACETFQSVNQKEIRRHFLLIFLIFGLLLLPVSNSGLGYFVLPISVCATQ